jgi:hypothetical protein
MFKGNLWKKIPQKSPHFEKKKVFEIAKFFVGFGQILFF